MELDFLSDPRFGVQELSEAIINYPQRYGMLTNMGLFGEQSINQTTVMLDILNRGQINIIPASPRGSPAVKQGGRTHNMRGFATFRHALADQLMADEFQNVRMFGSMDQFEVFETRLAEKMDDLNWKHWQTTEYLRWAALRGDVVSPGGGVLFNSYTLMDETQKTVEFDLNASTGDPIQDASNELLDYVEDNSFGEPISGYVVFCSTGFHDKLNKNTQFRDAFKYFMGMPNPNRESLRNGFEYKDLMYIRHRGRASYLNADGTRTTSKFIPDNEAIAVPMGTRQVFRTYYAPADYIETVNTMGQRLYAKADPLPKNRGVEIETVSQQLNICLKPRLIVRCTIKA